MSCDHSLHISHTTNPSQNNSQRKKKKTKTWFTKSILCYIFLYVFYAMDMCAAYTFSAHHISTIYSLRVHKILIHPGRCALYRMWIVDGASVNVRHVQWLCGLPQKHYNRNNTYTHGNVHLVSALWV